ncbi:outer membrane protein transport protein (OMPP1/FadL/TodX) [mine drainage metagenome]|jgi:long-subunit fatty acid transport protein|uniref:Outer membrane protein transport protein (OMPP1/FadL/TodX) n=1 Tax=mine drainage metagenome TaxID=410659 RepID=A0A1J5QWS0_9ZZZZ
MKNEGFKRSSVAVAIALALCSGPALAGGLDRTMEPVGILFAPGNYAELSIGYVAPTISGVGTSKTTGASSGNMTSDFTLPGFALKVKGSDVMDFALIYDRPFGADFSYPTGTGYYAQGWNGSISTQALTGIIKYRFGSGFSVYGGPRYETLSAQVSLPSLRNYDLSVSRATAFGYVAGVAYERPVSGTRASLTYNSKVDFSTTATESGGFGVAGSTALPIDMPQSIRLDLRQAISRTTVVLASARWADWPQTYYAPPDYMRTPGGVQPLLTYPSARWDFSAGIGHKFSSHWSGAIMLGYEPADGKYTGNLAPVDGKKSIGPVVSYTVGKVTITGLVSYIEVGDAQPGNNTMTASTANFTGNHAIAAGIKVGYAF